PVPPEGLSTMGLATGIARLQARPRPLESSLPARPGGAAASLLRPPDGLPAPLRFRAAAVKSLEPPTPRSCALPPPAIRPAPSAPRRCGRTGAVGSPPAADRTPAAP